MYLVLASAPASEAEKGGNGTAVGAAGARRRHAAQDGRQNKTLVFRSKVKTKKMKKTTGGGPRHRKEPRDDSACTRSRGICQASRYLCQGRYLRDKCAVARTRQCCVPGDPEPDRSPAQLQLNSLSLSLHVSLSTCLWFSLLLCLTLSLSLSLSLSLPLHVSLTL